MRNKIRDIIIRQIDNGYIAQVGCAELFFATINELAKELERYTLAPGEVEKEYIRKYRPYDLLPEQPLTPSMPAGGQAERR